MNFENINENHKPDLSIVVLCYKSGEGARDFTDKIIRAMQADMIDDYEIVLVGNYHEGENDITPAVLKNLSESNGKVRFIALPKPSGGMMGWDMRTGLNMAKGNYISIIDGDGQMPVEDIVRVYQKIKNEDFDLVKTYRITRGDSKWRKTLSFNYNLFFNFLFPGLGVRDINSKPKIIKREKYSMMNLSNDGWCIDAEIMIRARKLRLKIGELPTNFFKLGEERKSFVKMPAIFEFIIFLISYRLKEWCK
jgi:glycosyltransferase involved in cell wall biosynthesis